MEVAKLSPIAGMAALLFGGFSLGSYPKSQQLICQKVGSNRANCHVEIQTLAGWATTDLDSQRQYLGIQRAEVESIARFGAKSNRRRDFYVVSLVDQSGENKYEIERTLNHQDPPVLAAVNRVNQFLQSPQQIATQIDISQMSGDDAKGDSKLGKIISTIAWITIGAGLISMPRWVQFFGKPKKKGRRTGNRKRSSKSHGDC
jgi:hypothetical protein